MLRFENDRINVTKSLHFCCPGLSSDRIGLVLDTALNYNDRDDWTKIKTNKYQKSFLKFQKKSRSV